MFLFEGNLYRDKSFWFESVHMCVTRERKHLSFILNIKLPSIPITLTFYNGSEQKNSYKVLTCITLSRYFCLKGLVVKTITSKIPKKILTVARGLQLMLI
jgi:hypothetical protein